MKSRLRLVLALVLILLTVAPLSLADRKTFDELIKDTLRSSPDAFQLANGRALVSAFLFRGDTFDQIDAFLVEQRNQGAFVAQLEIAIAEAKAGVITDVCIEALPAPELVEGVNLGALSDAEVDRLTFTGNTSTLRRAASKEAMRRLVNRIALGTEYVADTVFNEVFDIAKPFNSLYEVRVFGLPQDRSHEEKVFDEFKIDVLDYNFGSKALSE